MNKKHKQKTTTPKHIISYHIKKYKQAVHVAKQNDGKRAVKLTKTQNKTKVQG